MSATLASFTNAQSPVLRRKVELLSGLSDRHHDDTINSDPSFMPMDGQAPELTFELESRLWSVAVACISPLIQTSRRSLKTDLATPREFSNLQQEYREDHQASQTANESHGTMASTHEERGYEGDNGNMNLDELDTEEYENSFPSHTEHLTTRNAQNDFNLDFDAAFQDEVRLRSHIYDLWEPESSAAMIDRESFVGMYGAGFEFGSDCAQESESDFHLALCRNGMHVDDTDETGFANTEEEGEDEGKGRVCGLDISW